MVSEMDASRRDYIQTKYKIIVEIDNNVVVKYSDVIIIAVKPQDIDGVLRSEICCGVSEKKLLVSVAAGVTTKYIEGIVGKSVPVIRAMPNMAARIGEAISSLSAGSSATREDMEVAREIFSTVGEVIEVDEKMVDAVTAVSGSGPAYFFYMAECLMDAAKKCGIDSETARKMAMKTFTGSAKLLEVSKEDPALLRKKVTSKRGTTEAALKIFEKRKFRQIVAEAVKAARTRSKELSGRKA